MVEEDISVMGPGGVIPKLCNSPQLIATALVAGQKSLWSKASEEDFMFIIFCKKLQLFLKVRAENTLRMSKQSSEGFLSWPWFITM